jgi:hypothetical protein
MLEHPLLWKFAILAVLIGLLLLGGAFAAAVDKLRAYRAMERRFKGIHPAHWHSA